MTESQKEEYVKKIWTNPEHPAGFVNPGKVYDVIKKEGKFKIGRGTIKNILSKEDALVFKNHQGETLREIEL